MIESKQVLLLCMASAMCISWILALKIQIIQYLGEAARLRRIIEPGTGAIAVPKPRSRLTVWDRAADDMWSSDVR
jgi:hypothetical protein